MSRAARAIINLSALQHNLNQVRLIAPGKQITAIIKANGYGHGMMRVAKALQDADAFGVASLEEAQLLRIGGITKPILLLEGFFSRDELDEIDHLALDMVIHQPEQLDILKRHGFFKQAPKSTLWLKLDTGMHRLGFDEATFKQALQFMQSHSDYPFKLMSHLANGDDVQDKTSQRQIQHFTQACGRVDAPRSMANSAGIVAWPESHMDVLRPGIMLYGANPLNSGQASDHGLEPVMTFRTRLIAVKQLKKGDPVGYGGIWRCPQDMCIGVAAIGYGDGYPRHAEPGTPVIVNNIATQLVGRVSMDMITVDLRPCEQSGNSAAVGDEVVLWGDGLPIEHVAAKSSTISYELLCGVTGRVEFVETDAT